jgi:hypothetical protein
MRVLVRPARLAAAVSAAVLAVSGAVLALPAAPATASPGADPGADPVAQKAASPALPAPPALTTAMFQLTVYEGEDDTGNELRQAVLICDPDSGNHPTAKAACDAMRAAGGDLDKLTAREGICIKVHQPVTAVVDGWYRGAVHFKKTYGNDCALRNALAPVFDF